MITIRKCYNLERRGNLSASEENYAELLTVLIEAYEDLACKSAGGIDDSQQP